MQKCEHNGNLNKFCISQHCEWKETAGCSLCIQKYHHHNSASRFISEEELQQLVIKLSFENVRKVNCRKMQESFYSYFKALKDQIIRSIDLLCKSLINSIGSPYLTKNQLFTPYKRLRDKQYKRLQQKQLRMFYEQAKKAISNQLIKEQSRLYKEQLQKSHKVIQSLEGFILNFQGLLKLVNESFIHDKSLCQNVNCLLKQTLQVSDLQINLQQINQQQIGKSKAQSAEKQSKIQKSLTNYHQKEFSSVRSAQQSVKLESDPKQESTFQQSNQSQIKNHEQILLSAIIQKQSSSQAYSKRQLSVDKKQVVFNLQKPQKIEVNANQRKSCSKVAPLQKIAFSQKNQSILNQDVFFRGSPTKIKKVQKQIPIQNAIQYNSSPQSAVSTKQQQQYTFNQRQINFRKEQLLQMMKDKSQAQKINKSQQKHQLISQDISLLSTQRSAKIRSDHLEQINELKQFDKLSIMMNRDNSRQQNQQNQKQNSTENYKACRSKARSSQKPRIQEKKNLETFHQQMKPRIQVLKPEISSIINLPSDLEEPFNQSLEVLKKILLKTSMHPHSKLPLEENLQKPKQTAFSRVITVHTNFQLKFDKNEGIESSLNKKKVNLNNANQKTPFKYQKDKQRQASSQQLKIDQLNHLAQNEQKSLNLLMNSIHLKSEEAIFSLENVLKLAPNNLSAAEYLSFLYLQNSKPKQTLRVCNLILDRFQIMTKQNEEFLLNLGNNKSAALNMLGRYSEAAVLLEKMIKIKENDKLLKNLADAYYFSSNYEKAVHYYQKATKITPFYDEAYYNMAASLYLQKNYSKARQNIFRALEIAPKNFEYIELKDHIDDRINQENSANCKKFKEESC